MNSGCIESRDLSQIQRANSTSNILNASRENLSTSQRSLDKLLNDTVYRNPTFFHTVNQQNSSQYFNRIPNPAPQPNPPNLVNGDVVHEPVWLRRGSFTEQQQSNQNSKKTETVLTIDGIPPLPSTVLCKSSKKINKPCEIVKSDTNKSNADNNSNGYICDATKSVNNYNGGVGGNGSSGSNCNLDSSNKNKAAASKDKSNKMVKSAQLSDDNYLLWITPVAAR